MKFDKVYREKKNPWGMKPDSIIRNGLPLFYPGTVLDLGVGDGRNALFLARHHYKIIGIDSSSRAIKLLRDKARRSGLKKYIRGKIASIEALHFAGIKNIISTFTFHFLSRKQCKQVISRMKQGTVEGGVHIIGDFTTEGPLFRAKTKQCFWRPNELRKLYNDWMVISYHEDFVKTSTTDHLGKPYIQKAAFLIARKP